MRAEALREQCAKHQMLTQLKLQLPETLPPKTKARLLAAAETAKLMLGNKPQMEATESEPIPLGFEGMPIALEVRTPKRSGTVQGTSGPWHRCA